MNSTFFHLNVELLLKEIKKLKKENGKLSAEKRALKNELAGLDKVIYFKTSLIVGDFWKINFSAWAETSLGWTYVVIK